MRKTQRLFAAACLAALVGFGVEINAQSKRGILPEDYFAIQTISDPHLSPDGKEVAYVVTSIDQKKNRRESSVWLVPSDSSVPPRKITAGGFSSSDPRWKPDGKMLAIISTRSTDSGATEPPKGQIFLMPMMGGGEAVALTHFKNGVESYQWSPDGTRLVAVVPSGPSDDLPPADHKSDVRHYTRILYKFNDSGWFDDKRRHLWIVDAADGHAKQITEGQEWNDTDPQWSPDGKRIAFVSDRTGKAYDDSHNTDVWVISAEAGGLTRISDHSFEDQSPRWSPDGKHILFTGKTAMHQFAKLYVSDSEGASPSQLAVSGLDFVPTELHWTTERSILFTGATKGEVQLFRGDVAARTITNVTAGQRTVHAVDVNETAGKMVYLVNDFQDPDDLYLSNPDGTGERQLTHLNGELWTKLAIEPADRLQYVSTDGLPIDGFLVKPVGWQAQKKYPMVLVIHGGPRDMFGFSWYQEFHVYSANGWAVLFCNPRGSTGYGEEFERAEIGNWGVMDYQDVMAGVDAALKKYSWIDAARLGLTGGSYGGFMTNWIVSHNDRFKAAVTLRSMSNLVSDEGTRDGPYGHEEYFKHILFDDFDQYWEASPLKHARDVHTPTLILHSEMDFRLPLEQGEQWFRALRHYGIPSELVVFPRENHNLTRTGEPKHVVESFQWQLYWFSRYLSGDPNVKAPDA